MIRRTILAIMLAMSCGCAARQPHGDYPYVPVYQARSVDGETVTEIGIGRMF